MVGQNSGQLWQEPFIYFGCKRKKEKGEYVADEHQDKKIEKPWQVYYYFLNPHTLKWERHKANDTKLNYARTLKDRYRRAVAAKKAMLRLLQEGYNPYLTQEEIKERLPKTIAQALESALLKITKRDISKGTKSRYESFARTFISKLKEKGYGVILADAIRFRHIEEAINSISEQRNYTNNTYNTFIGFIMDWFDFLPRMDIRKDNPARLLEYKTTQVKTGFHKEFTDQEIKRIDKELREKMPGLFLFWQFMRWTGRREVDILGIQVKNIIRHRRVIVLPKTKSGRPQLAMIPDILWECIIEFGILDKDPEYYVFSKFTQLKPGPKPITVQQIRKYWRILVKKGLGIDKNLYGTKHDLSTRLIKAGAPLKDVQQLLGHADPHTTLIYASGEQEAAFKNLKEAYKKLEEQA